MLELLSPLGRLHAKTTLFYHEKLATRRTKSHAKKLARPWVDKFNSKHSEPLSVAREVMFAIKGGDLPVEALNYLLSNYLEVEVAKSALRSFFYRASLLDLAQFLIPEQGLMQTQTRYEFSLSLSAPSKQGVVDATKPKPLPFVGDSLSSPQAFTIIGVERPVTISREVLIDIISDMITDYASKYEDCLGKDLDFCRDNRWRLPPWWTCEQKATLLQTFSHKLGAKEKMTVLKRTLDRLAYNFSEEQPLPPSEDRTLVDDGTFVHMVHSTSNDFLVFPGNTTRLIGDLFWGLEAV